MRSHVCPLFRWPALLLLMLVTGTLLAACSSGGDEGVKKDVATLKEQVAELQKQVATPAPVKVSAYKELGFTLPIPDGLKVQAAGLGSDKPSKEQGQLTASAGGVAMVMLWTKDKLQPPQAVEGAFEALQASQPSLAFRPVGQGDIKVDGQAGSYGAFGALDQRQQVISIGAIGAWNCGGQTFALTVAGASQQAVEASFQGFTSGFKCPA